MKMEESLPPGFRFHPTDEELIMYYLTRKISDGGFLAKAIAVVDLNKCEPWDLPGKATMGEKEWYFFSLKDRKYPTGLRTNRATESGYWKTTGKDKEIYGNGMLVGMKKTLVFYKGRAPRGEKSNWVMHEYRLDNKHFLKVTKEEWVVCRVFQKCALAKKPQQAVSSQLSVESPCDDTNSAMNELSDIDLSTFNTMAMANPSSGFSNVSPKTFSTDNADMMNLNLNWGSARDSLASLSWPAGSLLNPGFSMQSLLLKALQLRSLQQKEALTANFPYNNAPVGISYDHMSSGHVLQANSSSSTSKPLESVAVQFQHEQPFNIDSMW